MSVKDLYPAIRPSLNLDFANTKTLDPRITFSRASTGTYYDGVTHAKAEENLFTYSQQFDNAAWSKKDASVTADDTTAPDGTSTADKLVASGADTSVYVQQLISFIAGVDYTLSCFFKAEATNWAALRIGGSTAKEAFFDLQNGIVGTVSSGATSSIVDYGNGWYQCSMTCAPADSSESVLLLPAEADNDYISASSGVYLWGAQIEQRSSVTAYTATTTQPITNYIPVLQSAAAGEARFDHDPVTGESKGLLIEEQRTNLFQRSEEFDNAYWLKTNATVTANQAIAPDGTLSGDLVTFSGVGGNQTIYTFDTRTGAYTASVYIKAGDAVNVGKTVTFDTTGGGTNAKVVTLTDSWKRIDLPFNPTGYFQVRLISLSGRTANKFFLWGAQLEAGAFPTSYIKTTSAQATRSADSASMTGTNFSEWFNPSEGALFADFSVNAIEAQVNNGIAYISDGGSDNRIRINSANGGIRAQVRKNAVNTYDYTVSGYTSPSEQKAILAFKFNDAASIVSGDTVNTDSTVEIPQVDELDIGGAGGTVDFSGTIKKIAYWPQRLTNAQLQALTEG